MNGAQYSPTWNLILGVLDVTRVPKGPSDIWPYFQLVWCEVGKKPPEATVSQNKWKINKDTGMTLVLSQAVNINDWFQVYLSNKCLLNYIESLYGKSHIFPIRQEVVMDVFYLDFFFPYECSVSLRRVFSRPSSNISLEQQTFIWMHLSFQFLSKMKEEGMFCCYLDAPENRVIQLR